MEGKAIYPNSDEKLVNAVVLFAGPEGGLFYNDELTNAVGTEDALNLFKKGLILVSVDGGFKRPTGITVTESGYTIVYGEGGGSSSDIVVIDMELDTDNEKASAKINGETVYYSDIVEKIDGKSVVVNYTYDDEIHGQTSSFMVNEDSSSFAAIMATVTEGPCIILGMIGSSASENSLVIVKLKETDD